MKVSRTFLLAQALKDSKARAQKLQVPQEEKNQELWRILGKLYNPIPVFASSQIRALKIHSAVQKNWAQNKFKEIRPGSLNRLFSF
jgi:hypothetical protein